LIDGLIAGIELELDATDERFGAKIDWVGVQDDVRYLAGFGDYLADAIDTGTDRIQVEGVVRQFAGRDAL